ncbi:hypothetical protein SmJEL517_g04413 [Synchytrium microbalum]|uniref:Aminotransferase class I/classII large domain-containing protein n=1 Tax=Synchytrium microbalum TaxID=1806994 RepID=A0A507BZJ6_9FUNG|nr:uncharacterized protein SmJEL517_g04413 [Synchytrium microbalum]TPX32538.1 hypothetical protein SmJEL517_g04413 [Synchytrium microbalum]
MASTAPDQKFMEEDLTLFSTGDPNFISFEFGAPGPALLPVNLVTDATKERFSREKAWTSLQYGPSLGDAEFKDTLSGWLSTQYNETVAPEHLCVTNGASQAFSNLIVFFKGEHTKILLENPTYFLAIRTLADHGISRNELTSVPVDSAGVKVDLLEAALERLESEAKRDGVYPRGNWVDSGNWRKGGEWKGPKRYSYILFMVPIYSNPTGYSLKEERCQKVLDLARKYDVLVICDDVYSMLPLNNNVPPRRLVSYDNIPNSFGNVISNCSFSKLFAPGARLGWIEANDGIIEQHFRSGLMYSGGSPNHLFSGIMNSMISSGAFQSNLAFLKATYSKRLNIMVEYLTEHLPKNVTFQKPQGGFFLWLCLPEGEDSKEILQAVTGTQGYGGRNDDVVDKNVGNYRGRKVPKEKVSFASGNNFSTDLTHGRYLRLTWAFYEEERLLLGCERLCRVLNAALGSANSRM